MIFTWSESGSQLMNLHFWSTGRWLLSQYQLLYLWSVWLIQELTHYKRIYWFIFLLLSQQLLKLIFWCCQLVLNIHIFFFPWDCFLLSLFFSLSSLIPQVDDEEQHQFMNLSTLSFLEANSQIFLQESVQLLFSPFIQLFLKSICQIYLFDADSVLSYYKKHWKHCCI
mgnify:CR=1 FL=1